HALERLSRDGLVGESAHCPSARNRFVDVHCLPSYHGHSIILRLGLSLSTTPARRKRRTLPSCRPFLCHQSPPVGMSSPGSLPSRAAAGPLLEPGRADAGVGVSWLDKGRPSGNRLPPSLYPARPGSLLRLQLHQPPALAVKLATFVRHTAFSGCRI